MPLTDQDARALTYLAKRIRQDTHGAARWDEAGIYAEVAKLIGHDLAITAGRVIAHAADKEARTPGAIRRRFTPETPDKTGAAHPLKATEQCPHHPGQPAHNCGGCRADALADDKPGTPPPAWQPGNATTHARQIRARMGWGRTEGDAR